jgi:hypothetical protein
MPVWAKLIVRQTQLSLTQANVILATLRLAEHVTNLYLHEIALHRDQGSADLQPPFNEDVLTNAGGPKQLAIGPAHIGALGECLRSTHGILDTILSIELDVLLTLPVIFCQYDISCHSARRLL